MRIILDTGVFWRPKAIEALRHRPEAVVVPAVAYLERRRQLVRRGVPPEVLDALLDRGDFVVEPFGRREANRVAALRLDEAAWRRLARDAMIGGHVGPGDVLWTTNPRDFLALGVPAGQVHAIACVRSA